MLKKDMYKRYKKVVIMNEQHSLLPEQQNILADNYGEYEILSVPSNGWTVEEMNTIINSIQKDTIVIFVSPIPYMIMELTRKETNIVAAEYCYDTGVIVKVFHNDNREKKELPNGAVIMTVAKEGWVLL